jgi:hypothetical protein
VFRPRPLNPNRTLERELADADREESDPEDPDPEEVEPLATRWGGNRVLSTVSSRQKLKELRDCGIKTFHPIIENKKSAIDPERDPKPDPEPRTQNPEPRNKPRYRYRTRYIA